MKILVRKLSPSAPMMDAEYLATGFHLDFSRKLTCKTKQNRDEIENHLHTCEYRITTCDLCGNRVITKDIPKHHEFDCPEVKIKCFCGKDV